MKSMVSIVLPCAALGFAFPAFGGSGVGVRYIEHADPYNTFLDVMSDDGSTLVFYTIGEVPSIIIDRGAGLQTVYEGGSPSQSVWSGGVSDDGGLVAINALYGQNTLNWNSGSISGIPDYVYNGTPLTWTFTGAVSGDGRVNGIGAQGGGESRVLLYHDRTYLDLRFDAEGLSSTLEVTGLDRSGSVLTMNQKTQNPSWGDPDTRYGSRAWMWDPSGFTEIPDLVMTGDRVDSHVSGVSSDGSTVFGVSNAIFFGEELGHVEYGPSRAWIYRDGIQTEVQGEGLGYVEALDITDDGQTLLLNAGLDTESIESYLWTEQGGLESIADILAREGVVLSGNSVLFNALSGDGTVLAGNIYTEGYGYTSVVVTIPSPGALLMIGGGLLMLSGRRR